MRVAIVGSREARAHLRARLPSSSIEVVAEYSTLAEARAAGIAVDAVLMTPDAVAGPAAAANDPGAGGRRDFARARHGWEDRAIRRSLSEIEAETLTSRELQVLELMAEGLPNKAIARRLGISDQTVKFHVASISGKLGASNRTDAVRRAVRRGLLTL